MKEVRDYRTGVEGFVAPGFLPCADAFRKNFLGDGELGAACAIYRKGELVLDMWGGVARRSEKKIWSRDSIVPVFSVTKGVGAICILHLVRAGLLELDRPIADYWPEFEAHGKGRVTVREGLAHRAGVPVVDGHVSLADIQDTRTFADRDHGIAFAYVRNRMNLKNIRDGPTYTVIDALHTAIGLDEKAAE